MDCQTANLDTSDLDLSEKELDVELDLDAKSLTPTDSIQNLHHEHHINHHSPLHCRQHYTSSSHGFCSGTIQSSKSLSQYQNSLKNNSNCKSFYLSNVSSSPSDSDYYLKQLSTLRQEERNLLKEIQQLENATIEEDDEELIEFQRIERDIKLAEINKCLTLIRTQISKHEAEAFQREAESLERQSLRAPLAESEGDTDSQVSSRNNESPAITSPNFTTTSSKVFLTQRFVHLSDSSSDSDSAPEDDEENRNVLKKNLQNNGNQNRNQSPSMVHEIMLQERIERSLASVGRQQDEVNVALRCLTLGETSKIDSSTVTISTVDVSTASTTNTGSAPHHSQRRGSEYENEDYHQCHSTHEKSLEFLDSRESRLGKRYLDRDFEEKSNHNFASENINSRDDVIEIEEEDDEDMIFDHFKRFPKSENNADKGPVIFRTQQQQAASSSSLASNAQRPLTLYLPSANSQLNLITHLHALGHDLTNTVVTNNLLITPFTCSGYLYKQCSRSQVGRKRWRKRYFHFNRIRSIFVYYDDRAAFEKHQHPKRGVFFDKIQDVYVDHTKSKVVTTHNKSTNNDDTQQSQSTTGRLVFVVSTTEINRKFILSTFVPELMRIWMDVIFTGANGYLQDYEDYEN